MNRLENAAYSPDRPSGRLGIEFGKHLSGDPGVSRATWCHCISWPLIEMKLPSVP
jgi:hypothetical protein